MHRIAICARGCRCSCSIYGLVAVVAIDFGGVDRLGASDSPLRDLVGSVDSPLEPLVQLGAGIASVGVLLNLIPGVSRTTLAMARNREVPGWFAHIDEKRSLPLRAELTVAAVVVALVLTIDITSSIAVSGVAVLTYYAVTNAAAITLSSAAVAQGIVVGCRDCGGVDAEDTFGQWQTDAHMKVSNIGKAMRTMLEVRER